MQINIKKLGQNEIISNLITILVVIFFSYILFFKLFAFVGIASASMEPTLMTGDLTIENRLAYYNRTVERGDIVTFYKEKNGVKEIWGKRVIGLPNETISFHDGNVYVDGELLGESYIDDEIETNCNKTFVVPENCYFMLGDNRAVSNDSRYWDEPYVNKSDIFAKYLFSIPVHYLRFNFKKNEENEKVNPLCNAKGIGDVAVIAAETFSSDYYKMATITFDDLLTENEATIFLKAALGSDYKDPDENMSWCVMEYSSSISPDDAYIDIRIEGLDGNNLVSNGKSYSKRTFDIYKYVYNTNAMYYRYYCYYQIPKDCKEYLIEMGIFNDNSAYARKYNAFYMINL